MFELKSIKNPTLLRDLSSSQIAELQIGLSRIGLYPPTMIDGIIGHLTLSGWDKFKSQNYLGQSDVVGPSSIALLKEKSKILLSREKFDLCFKMATVGNKNIYYQPLEASMKEFHINTPSRIAAFFAQIAHESGSLLYSQEIADGSAYEFRKDLGNFYKGDGKRYKGRGLIQLTGRFNYRAVGNALDLPLEADPGRAIDPFVSARIAGYYWHSRNLNPLADIGGENAFREITRRINGGLNGWKDRLFHWEWMKKVLC